MSIWDIFERKENVAFKPLYQVRRELYDYDRFIRDRIWFYLNKKDIVPYLITPVERKYSGFLFPTFEREFIEITLKKYKFRDCTQYIAINKYGGMFLEIAHFLAREPKFFRRFLPIRLEGLLSFRQYNEYLDLKSWFEVVDEIVKLAILEAETDLENKKELKKAAVFNI